MSRYSIEPEPYRHADFRMWVSVGLFFWVLLTAPWWVPAFIQWARPK